MPRFTRTYLEFLKSPEWQRKRAKIIARDGGKCVVCRSPRELQVDHIRYPDRDASFKAFVGQRLDQLQTLCRGCHERKTRRSRGGLK
jgi:5-methylcytosine-specific restriction endonuclease McrA